jgi:hypothetical protein
VGQQTSLIHTNSTTSQRQTTLKTHFDMFYLIYLRASCQNLVEKEWAEIKKSIFIFMVSLRQPTFFSMSFGFCFLPLALQVTSIHSPLWLLEGSNDKR